MAYMDVISPENRDISKWTKNMTSFPVFENSCENSVNFLDYQGGGGHERLYLPVTVKANTDYIFSVDFASPTGFTCGGYDGVYEEYIAVTYNNPGSTGGLKSLALLGLSEPLLQEASDTPSTYTVSFNSDRYTTVYLVINFGYITDFVTIRMIYSNIKLKTYTPWIMSNNYPTNTEFVKMPESYMSKPYPKALWRIDRLTNNGIPYHLLMPDIESKGRGAFYNAKKLTRISIPESVKKIGKESFRYTALKSVRIAPDCEFYDTSFPDDCEILFYGGGSYFVPLYDKDDFILLDKTGAQIVVRSK